MRPLHAIASAGAVAIALLPLALGNSATAQQKDPGSRTIIAGVPKSFPPHYVVSDDGRASGFAIDVLNSVAKRANFKVEYRVFRSWTKVADALKAGEVDLVPNMGITEERKKYGLFSAPYESFRVNLFVRAGDDEIPSLKDLANKLVGVVRSNVAQRTVPKYSNIPPRIYETSEELVSALVNHQIDVLAYPAPVVERIARNKGVRNQIKRTGPPLVVVERGIEFAEDRADLLRALGPYLNHFVASREFDEIYERWFGEARSRSSHDWRDLLTTVFLVMVAAMAILLLKGPKALTGGLSDPKNKRLERRLWKRAVAVAVLIFAVTFGVSGLVILFIYNVTFDEKRQALQSQVENTQQLIDAVARFDRQQTDSAESARASTLVQIRDGIAGVKPDIEIVVGEKVGGNIKLILRQKAARLDAAFTFPSAAPGIGEPMRLALSGETGTVVGPDYSGVKVLAAYAPLRPLGLGLVIKQDMSAIRAPYIGAGWTVALMALAVALVGSLVYFALTLPIFRTIVRSEERFALALQGANDGLFDWDVAENTVYYSPRWKSMLGYGDDEVANDFAEWESRLHPNDVAEARERVENFLARPGSELRSEFRMRHKDGHWVDILARAFGVWNKDGKCVRVVGTHIDMSEIRRIEAKVEDYAKFAERNPNPVLKVGSSGEILLANPAAQNFLTALAPGGSTSIAESDRQAWREFLEFAKSAKNRNQYQLNFAEHTYIFEIVPEPDSSTINLYATDITARRRAEEDLQMLLRGIEDSQSLVIVTDLEGAIEYLNPQFLDVTGYRRDELIGRSVKILRPEAFQTEKYDELWNTVREGKNWRGELTYRRKDGSNVLLRMSVSPVHDAQRNLTHFIGINEDITESRAVEEQLRQSQKLEAVGQLTGGVAHDFNNLLSVIYGNLQLIGMDLGEEKEIKEHLEAAEAAVIRGADLTRRLLAFSRQEKLDTAAHDTNAVISELFELLSRSLGELIDLQFHPLDGLWQTTVNRSQLENAIINLCNNARDAMPEGGRVIIETDNAHLDDAYAAKNVGVEPGDYITIAVTDEGMGMPPDVVEHIFEPFFTTKEEGKGTGLGMSMVYGFVKQAGGQAKVYSEVGRGTTVRLYLPRTTGVAEVPAPIAAANKPDLTPHTTKILVVEDQESVRKTVIHMLEKFGHDVVSATNGREAMTILENGELVDILFTDIVMPEIDGIELAKRARECRPHLRVLFTSGYADRAMAENGELPVGAEMISKPYSAADLAEKIEKVMRLDA